MKYGLLFLAWALPLCARTGIVQTREGATHLGSIRLEQDRLVIANVDRAELIPVEAGSLRRATFERPLELLSDDPVRHAWSSLPARWEIAELGGASGTVGWRGGLFRVAVSGTVDSGRVEEFVYQSVEDESELVMRVLSVNDETGPFAAAGLTLRENLKADARFLFLGLTAGQGGVLQWRDQPSSAPQTVRFTSMTFPSWIRLKRERDSVRVFKSSNGNRWQLIDRLELNLGSSALAGFSVVAGEKRRVQTREKTEWPVDGTALLDNVRLGRSIPISSFVPRARLKSGSVVAGKMQTADGKSISFLGPLPRPTLRAEDITSLEFQWPTAKALEGLEAGRTGVFLTDGEFVEGEFRGIEGDRLKISSVLFGLKSYDVNSDVMVVVIRPAAEMNAPYEVVTGDGSIWRASALQIGEHEVIIREPTLGKVHISAHNLLEIRRNAD